MNYFCEIDPLWMFDWVLNTHLHPRTKYASAPSSLLLPSQILKNFVKGLRKHFSSTSIFIKLLFLKKILMAPIKWLPSLQNFIQQSQNLSYVHIQVLYEWINVWCSETYTMITHFLRSNILLQNPSKSGSSSTLLKIRLGSC